MQDPGRKRAPRRLHPGPDWRETAVDVRDIVAEGASRMARSGRTVDPQRPCYSIHGRQVADEDEEGGGGGAGQAAAGGGAHGGSGGGGGGGGGRALHRRTAGCVVKARILLTGSSM